MNKNGEGSVALEQIATAFMACFPQKATDFHSGDKTPSLYFHSIPEDDFDQYIKRLAKKTADKIPDNQLAIYEAACVITGNQDYIAEPYSLEGMKAGLEAVMEDYAVASIVEGKSLADWHKKLRAIMESDQALAVRITTNFRNYEESGKTDPTPKVTLARIAMRIDEPLMLLAQPPGAKQVLLDQMGRTEEDLRDLVLDEMEMFAVYAQKTGEFGREWHRIVRAVAQHDPALAAEATRYTIDPVSIASPDNNRERVAACHIAQTLAVALKDAGYYHNAARLARRLLDRAQDGFNYLGYGTPEKVQSLYNNIMDEWQVSVDAIPDAGLRHFAQEMIDKFKPSQQGTEKPGSAPGGLAPGGPV